MRDEQEVRARMAGFKGMFVKELQRQKSMARQQQYPAPEGARKNGQKVSSSSFSSHSASSRLGIGSSANLMKVSEDLSRAEASYDRPARDRNELIEGLISNGQTMMRKGVFSIPKLRWRRDELADPQEKRVLDMIGFLLDAYDKKAWWWEVFEMNRKLMLAGEGVYTRFELGVFTCTPKKKYPRQPPRPQQQPDTSTHRCNHPHPDRGRKTDCLCRPHIHDKSVCLLENLPVHSRELGQASCHEPHRTVHHALLRIASRGSRADLRDP